MHRHAVCAVLLATQCKRLSGATITDMLLLLFLLLTARASALNASIVYGVLTVDGSSPRVIGNTSSAVSAAIASTWPHGGGGNASTILKNSSSFYSYLTLTGDYAADAPILLPPALVLVLADASISTQAPALPGPNALIAAVSAAWAAVVGRGRALLACSASGGKAAPAAVYAGQSAGFVLDGVQVTDCSGVHMEGLPLVTGGEVANCLMRNTRQQAVWLEKISRAVVHGNTITNASYHTIDFDAFSSNGLAMNNTVSFSREEAVFIEQGATYITVVDNDLGPGNARGVAVYNNAIGSSTAGHVIARNRIWGSTSSGIAVGSTAPRSGAPDVNVLIAGNRMWGNGQPGQGIHSNGGQIGTLYVANDDADGASIYTLTGAGTAVNLSFADPSDRVAAASV